MRRSLAMVLLMGVLLTPMQSTNVVVAGVDIESAMQINCWTDIDRKADFNQKYLNEGGFVEENLSDNGIELLKEYLYITEEERKDVIESGNMFTNSVNVNLNIELDIDDSGKVIKTIVYYENGNEYFFENIENQQVKICTPSRTRILKYLLDEEIAAFESERKLEKISTNQDYSIESIREYLNDTENNTELIESYNMPRNVSTTTEVDICPVEESEEYGEKIAESTGRCAIYIAGSSDVTYQETDVIFVDTYFSIIDHYEISKETELFEAGETIQNISDTLQVAKDWIEGTLTAWDIVDLTLGVLLADVEIVCEHAYQVSFYREATTMDYTIEMTDVELQEREYIQQIALGYTEYNATTGEFGEPYWVRISGEDTGTVLEYARYAATLYYNICVNQGKWIFGVNACGGLGGYLIKLPTNRHTHTFTSNWEYRTSSYHYKYCTNCGIVIKENHILSGGSCIVCEDDGAVIAGASEQENHESN